MVPFSITSLYRVDIRKRGICISYLSSLSFLSLLECYPINYLHGVWNNLFFVLYYLFLPLPFFLYLLIGHGGRVRDTSGDEDDGYDETLIPVDFMQAGQIVDDDLFDKLIKPLPANCQMTSLMDCCHSGTVLDLPYRFTADGDVEAGMERTEGFNFGAGALAAGACCFFEMFSFLSEFL